MIIHDSFDQGSLEWFVQRAGRPTASNFKFLVTPSGKASASIRPYAASLAAEAFVGMPLQDFKGTQHTKRGHELEPEANAYYQMKMNADVNSVGFITDDLERYGCSPDGMVVGANGGTEYKCLNHEKHTLCLADIQQGICPADYYPQVQGEILVCEFDWVDFVCYHPDLPTGIFRVYPEPEYQQLLKSQITVCIKQRDQFIHMYEAMS